MSVEEAELPALLKIAEALKVIIMIMSSMATATMTMMTMMTIMMMTMVFQVKGLVESEEERQGGGSAKATPVKYQKNEIFTPVKYLNI